MFATRKINSATSWRQRNPVLELIAYTTLFRSLFAVLCASIALADDFKTIDGKEYKNVTVKRVEPDGLVLSSKSGISKVYFTELTTEVQEQFHYDPKAADEYTVEQEKAFEEVRK